MVVSNIFYFHPYLRKISNFTNIFQMGWVETTNQLTNFVCEETFSQDFFRPTAAVGFGVETSADEDIPIFLVDAALVQGSHQNAHQAYQRSQSLKEKNTQCIFVCAYIFIEYGG